MKKEVRKKECEYETDAANAPPRAKNQKVGLRERTPSAWLIGMRGACVVALKLAARRGSASENAASTASSRPGAPATRKAARQPHEPAMMPPSAMPSNEPMEMPIE